MQIHNFSNTGKAHKHQQSHSVSNRDPSEPPVAINERQRIHQRVQKLLALQKQILVEEGTQTGGLGQRNSISQLTVIQPTQGVGGHHQGHYTHVKASSRQWNLSSTTDHNHHAHAHAHAHAKQLSPNLNPTVQEHLNDYVISVESLRPAGVGIQTMNSKTNQSKVLAPNAKLGPLDQLGRVHTKDFTPFTSFDQQQPNQKTTQAKYTLPSLFQTSPKAQQDSSQVDARSSTTIIRRSIYSDYIEATLTEVNDKTQQDAVLRIANQISQRSIVHDNQRSPSPTASSTAPIHQRSESVNTSIPEMLLPQMIPGRNSALRYSTQLDNSLAGVISGTGAAPVQVRTSSLKHSFDRRNLIKTHGITTEAVLTGKEVPGKKGHVARSRSQLANKSTKEGSRSPAAAIHGPLDLVVGAKNSKKRVVLSMTGNSSALETRSSNKVQSGKRNKHQILNARYSSQEHIKSTQQTEASPVRTLCKKSPRMLMHSIQSQEDVDIKIDGSKMNLQENVLHIVLGGSTTTGDKLTDLWQAQKIPPTGQVLPTTTKNQAKVQQKSKANKDQQKIKVGNLHHHISTVINNVQNSTLYGGVQDDSLSIGRGGADKSDLQAKNLSINKLSAMQRHQDLNSDTCDFLLSLVKTSNTNSVNADAYRNSFSKAQQRPQKPMNINISFETSQSPPPPPPHKVSLSQKSDGTANFSGGGYSATIQYLSQKVQNDDIKLSKEAMKGLAPQHKKEVIQAMNIRQQPSSKHVQRLMSPIKRHFKIAAELSEQAAQIAMMSVNGEQQPLSPARQMTNSVKKISSRVIKESTTPKAPSTSNLTHPSTPQILCPKCQKPDLLGPNHRKRLSSPQRAEEICKCNEDRQESGTNGNNFSNATLRAMKGHRPKVGQTFHIGLQVTAATPIDSEPSSRVSTRDKRQPHLAPSVKHQNASFQVHMLQQLQSNNTKLTPTNQQLHNDQNSQTKLPTDGLVKKKAIQPRNTPRKQPREKFVKNSPPALRVQSMVDFTINRDIQNSFYDNEKHQKNRHVKFQSPQLVSSAVQTREVSDHTEAKSPGGQSSGSTARVPAKPIELTRFSPVRTSIETYKLDSTGQASTDYGNVTGQQFEFGTILKGITGQQIVNQKITPTRVQTRNDLQHISRQGNDGKFHVGIMTAKQQSQIRKHVSVQNILSDSEYPYNQAGNEGDFVLSSTRSNMETVRNMSSQRGGDERDFSMTQLSLKIVKPKIVEIDMVETPTTSPLKARLGSFKHKPKLLSKKASKLIHDNAQSLASLKSSPTNRQMRKKITSILSSKHLHHLNAPSTIISIGSQEHLSTHREHQSLILEPSQRSTETLHQLESSPNQLLIQNSSRLLNGEGDDGDYKEGEDKGTQAEGVFPTLVTDSQNSGGQQQWVASAYNNELPTVTNFATISHHSGRQHRSEMGSRTLQNSPVLVPVLNIVNEDFMVSEARQVDIESLSTYRRNPISINSREYGKIKLVDGLDLVDEVSKSSEYTQMVPGNDSRKPSRYQISRIIDSASSISRRKFVKAYSSTAQTINNGNIAIVDQKQYQESCEKILIQNMGLQEAINLTSRTPISPATILVTGVQTNEQSSAQSFYKLDESILRVGGYTMATGRQQIVKSGQSSRQTGDDNFSFKKLMLPEDSVLNGTPKVLVQPSQHSNPAQTTRYAIQRQEGGIQVTSTTVGQSPAQLQTEEQAIEAFLEQIDLKCSGESNAETQVQNISSYLNVRRADPLLLFPNFKHEDEPLPCKHLPAFYLEPKMAPLEQTTPCQVTLEHFQF